MWPGDLNIFEVRRIRIMPSLFFRDQGKDGLRLLLLDLTTAVLRDFTRGASDHAYLEEDNS